jgi:ribosomal protein S18 acetylase RimI-like enzyme
MYREATPFTNFLEFAGPRNQVRVALPSEAESAIAVVTLAFSTDPVARWVYPDPADYLSYFPEFLQAFAGNSFTKGSAYVTPDLSGAALWLKPGVHSDDEALLALFSATVAENVQEDLFAVLAAMNSYHPKEPHWYLPNIGVDTAQQNKGIGAKLLEKSLADCDDAGMTAYLESSNPRNISLYNRFGFKALGTIQIGNAPPITPMVRRAQS